ncbi:MAG: DUF4388 domain-containing protein [Planctomycetota bacterium]|nr:DUF4388 domain-containing protein [Planctomycetota bacterium]
MSSLRGHLEHFGLQELLQTLSHGARTGTLQIERNDEKVSIVFETGHITVVRTGSSSHIRFRSILLRGGIVSEADLLQARKDQEETGMLLGRALIERGIIDDAQLSQALRLKVEEELFDLFLWESGTFEFFPKLIQSTAEDDIHQVTRIQVDPMSVIIEGLRQADEWKVIRDRIQDLHWILVPVDGTPAPAESHSLYKLVDGHRSTDEVLALASSTRFDTCSVLYRFIEEGKLREATHGEMLKEARARVQDRPASSLCLYESLIERAGSSMGHTLLEEAADCAAHHDPSAQADFIRQAVEILRSHGDGPGAWIRLQRLLVLAPGSLEDLLGAWSLREYIPTRRVLTLLDELTKALRRAGEYRQLSSILRDAEPLRGTEPSYWLQLGEALQRCKDPEAEVYLARAIQISDKKEPEVALRAERMLRDLNSDLALGDEDVEQLRQRRTDIDSHRKLRRGVVLGAAGLLFALCLLQVSSEWRARGLLSAARSIEASGNGISGMKSAAIAFERVSREHPWTFAGNNGARSSDRLRDSIQQQQHSDQRAQTADLQMQRTKRLEKLMLVRKSIRESQAFRKQGDVIAARKILDAIDPEALDVLPEIEFNSIQVPVLIESRPIGARVLNSMKKFVGITPTIVDVPLGDELKFFVERPGCRTKSIQLSGSSPATVAVALVRGPLRTYTLPGPVQQAALAGDSLVLAGRDGQVRIVDVNQLSSIGEHVIGIEGHPTPILIEQNGIVLAVPYSGRPVIVRADGKVRPFGPAAKAPWSAACGLDRGWVLADVEGRVIHLDSRGKTRWEYNCNAPVALLGSSAEGQLYVIDAARFQHRIGTDGKQVGSAVRLPGEAMHLLPDGRALLHDGRMWKPGSMSLGPAPSTTLRHEGPRSLYGTENGWAVFAGSSTEEHQSPSAAACAPLESSSGDGATWIAGVDGILRLHDSNGEIASEVELGATAIDLQRSEQGRILVTLSDGRLCDVEELKR